MIIEPRRKKEERRFRFRLPHIRHELFCCFHSNPPIWRKALVSRCPKDWWWYKNNSSKICSFKTDITSRNISLNQVTSGENHLISNDYHKFTVYIPIPCYVLVVHVQLSFITLFIHSKKMYRVSSIPASSVVTFRIGLLLLLPILFLANTLILYVVRGKK